jgi:IS4 transposase
VEVLITNMMDCEAYEVDLFKELYYLRWGIEENYKRLNIGMSYRQSSFSTERFMGAPVRPASNSTTQKTLLR